MGSEFRKESKFLRNSMQKKTEEADEDEYYTDDEYEYYSDDESGGVSEACSVA